MFKTPEGASVLQSKLVDRYVFSIPRRFGIVAEAILVHPKLVLLHSRFDSGEYDFSHEDCHVRQMKREGWIRHVVKYYTHYGLNYLRYRNWAKAYKAIPYEQECYGEDEDSMVRPDYEGDIFR